MRCPAAAAAAFLLLCGAAYYWLAVGPAGVPRAQSRLFALPSALPLSDQTFISRGAARAATSAVLPEPESAPIPPPPQQQQQQQPQATGKDRGRSLRWRRPEPKLAREGVEFTRVGCYRVLKKRHGVFHKNLMDNASPANPGLSYPLQPATHAACFTWCLRFPLFAVSGKVRFRRL
eukprot:TRINITY_DN18109_c0_g1_i1.p1 TRINITY_DN18109_c0_g1~~TRINITY_DN18109_c0_g1_i1.p1  ORF type:complete len:176 (-),score=13.20 TRINITY_DN18109_c0_g1_i1:28-555(-)